MMYLGELRYYSEKRGGITIEDVREAAERNGVSLWEAKLALEERTQSMLQQWDGQQWLQVPYVLHLK